MSTTFRTAVVRTPGGPDSIEIIDVPVVAPGPGQVLVKIAGAAVNPVDLAVAAGVFHGLGLVHQPDHTGLGWEFAGTVIAAGPGRRPPARQPRRRAGRWVRPRLRHVRRAADRAGERQRPRARRSRPDHGSNGPAQRPGRGPAGRPARRRRRPEPARDRGCRRGRRVRHPARPGPRLADHRTGPSHGREVRARPRRRLHHRGHARLGRGRRRCRPAGAGRRSGPRRRPLRRRPAGRGARSRSAASPSAWW